MGRILVVTHSANERDATLWKTVLHHYPHVDIVFPRFESGGADTKWIEPLCDRERAFLLPAREPFGKGHSALWLPGLENRLETGQYSLLHAAVEPWSLIPQFFVKRIPTVVQGAESIVVSAPIKLRLRRVGLRRVLKNIAGLSAWGRTSIDAFVQAGLPARTPRAVIPMGIPDPAVFTRTPVPEIKDTVNLLYVGRLDPEKGVQTVIEALHLMPTSARFHFRVLGSGSMERQLRSMVDADLSSKIDFEGQASLVNVRAAMRWAHLVVVPSLVTPRWMEQWGRVPVEAILSGRPCLVSDSGELPYVSPIPQTVFRVGERNELRDRILQVTTDVQTLQSLADQQYLSVQRFQPVHLAEQTVELWRNALGNS